jgi:hypothetical protein
VGVGAAALGTGLVLWLTGPDPDKYEPKTDSNVFAKSRVIPTAWVSERYSGIGLEGTF